jgi:hypothetical protein
MNEQRLRALLGETPVPGAADAERRGRAVVEAAFAERQPDRPRPAPRRLALTLAAATLLLAVILSPAGAAVRDWIDDTLTVGVRDAEPALTEIPGGGRLLVSSPQGAWLVQADGSRRLLGSYEEATWSPRGLFVAAASGHTLSAVAPHGTVRWSLSALGEVSDPRWSPSGLRVAYRAGRSLHVVAGDGTGDGIADPLLDAAVAPVAPAWLPGGPHVLAYLDAGGALRLVAADSGETVGSAEAPPGVRQLSWAPDGSRLVAATRRSLWVYGVRADKLGGLIVPGPPQRLIPLPRGAVAEDVAFSPRGDAIAVLLMLPAEHAGRTRSELVLIDSGSGSGRALFRAPGRLSGLAFSPGSERLLIGWPAADQWLFIPVDGGSRVRAIGGISAEFGPGAPPDDIRFPRLAGWCCY